MALRRHDGRMADHMLQCLEAAAAFQPATRERAPKLVSIPEDDRLRAASDGKRALTPYRASTAYK